MDGEEFQDASAEPKKDDSSDAKKVMGTKAKRGVTRTLFTKKCNKLDKLIQDGADVEDIAVEFTQLQALNDKLNVFNELVMDEIAAINSETAESELLEEMSTSLEYASKYGKLELKVQKCYQRNEEDIKSSTSSCHPGKEVYKLPKLELKKFDLSGRTYAAFWSQFQDIHERDGLKKSSKFSYLLQSLSEGSRAYKIVSDYPISDESYDEVILQLQTLFGRKEMRLAIQVNELLNFVNEVENSPNKYTLSQIYDKLSSLLRILGTLGLPSDKFAHLLLTMILPALPMKIISDWLDKREIANGEDDIFISIFSGPENENPLESLMQFMGKQVAKGEGLQLLHQRQNSSDFVNANRSGTGTSGDNRIKGKDLPSAVSLVNTTSIRTAGNSSNPGKPIDNTDVKPKLLCPFCSKDHPGQECIAAQKLKFDEKKELLKKNNRCFVCFKNRHKKGPCKAPIRCVVCKERHFPLMCTKLPENTQSTGATGGANTSDSSSATPPTRIVTSVATTSPIVYLKTMRTFCLGFQESIRVLLDDASQRSYITTALVQRLGLRPVGREYLTQSLFGGFETAPICCNKYKLTLIGLHNSFHFEVVLLEYASVCCNLPIFSNETIIHSLRDKGVILTETPEDPPNIDILLGSDVLGRLWTGNMKVLPCGLTAMETHLGWSIMGSMGSQRAGINTCSMFVGIVPDLWELSILGIEDPVQVVKQEKQDAHTLEFFRESTMINAEGRYEVRLPWKIGGRELYDNYFQAKARLQHVTVNLRRRNLFEDYHKVFLQWKADGIIEDAPPTQGRAYYLPHRPVIKESSATTKIRPVFDGSAKMIGGASLNESLNTGPNLIKRIPAILFNFRRDKIAISADIKQAFLQISVHPSDRDVLRFLWWEGESTTELKVYRHTRVVFGITSSPFHLSAVLNLHLEQLEFDTAEYAEVIHRLKDSFYVDNYLDSVPDSDTLERVKTQACEILSRGRFDLRCWMSNQPSSSFEEQPEETSVLGLKWNLKEDVLYCVGPKIDFTKGLNKRFLLSLTNSIYDPIGFLCPALITPYILLQEMWIRKLDWDTELPEDLAKRFQDWISDLSFLSLCRLPRLLTQEGLNSERCSIHVFSDASQIAYAACIFLRSATEDGTVKIALITAKTRLAPTESCTIPRLELLGCLLGVRLHSRLLSPLISRDIPTYFWTDSTVALAWITHSEPWAAFVANRVKEIRENSDISDWRHIPGPMNPADLPSRGCSFKELHEKQWWNGPKWLLGPKESWPNKKIVCSEEALKERKKRVVTAVNVIPKTHFTDNFRRFSNYKSIVRICAWMLRYLNNLRQTPQNRRFGELTGNEIQQAERSIVRLIQREWPEEKKLQATRRMVTYTEDNGELRIKTRLLLGAYTQEFQCPVVLPPHWLTERLIFYYHLQFKHAGVQTMLNYLRDIYWVPQGRRYIRKILRTCIRCRRFGGSTVIVNPAPLPPDRIKCSSVFQVIGVDLAGPIYLQGKEKSWIILFTCAVYRAVHLELITGLSTLAFMQGFRRFISRRGRCTDAYSDNGTNFHGTDNALQALDWTAIQKETVLYKINWHFNPPSAPWWGGFWERLIGVMKGLLRRCLGNACLNYQEMSTLLCEIENVVNDRPLTYLSEDPNELRPLTPNHFLRPLTGRMEDFDLVDRTSCIRRLNYLQDVRDNLKRRFQDEYIGALLQQSSKKSSSPAIKVGDIVLVQSDTAKRVQWPMAKVLQLAEGRDGVQRVAHLQLAAGKLTRPVERLVPLEISAPEDLSDDLKNFKDTDIKVKSEPSQTDFLSEPVIEDFKMVEPTVDTDPVTELDEFIATDPITDTDPVAVSTSNDSLATFSSRGRLIKTRKILDL